MHSWALSVMDLCLFSRMMGKDRSTQDADTSFLSSESRFSCGAGEMAERFRAHADLG